MSSWIIGQGGPGAQAALNISTYMPNPGTPPNCEIVAIDSGSFGCTFQILTLRPGSGTNPLLVRIQINPDGTMAFPTMPQKSVQGSDLEIDPQGNVGIQLSTARAKENITELKDDFSKVLNLEPKSFVYRDTGKEGIGYIAEDVDELELKNLVTYDAKGDPLTVNYKMISVYLLELLKSQARAIGALTAEVNGLKSKLA